MPTTERCRHDFLTRECGLCQIRAPATRVWVSGTRSIYHRTETCSALREGKGIAERKGYNLADVIPMTLARAIDRGCVPCLVCGPPTEQRLGNNGSLADEGKESRVGG